MSQLGFEAAPLSRSQIRDFATQVRSVFQCRSIRYVDVEKLLDFIVPQVLPDFSYEISPRAEMGNNHGLANPDEGWIRIREDVHERACNGHGRDRLTVVHELGHLLLHGHGRVMLRRGVGPPVAYKDPEWQANAFAGEFLVFHELARDCYSAAELAASFGVTLAAAEVQFNSFRRAGIINTEKASWVCGPARLSENP